MIARMQPCRPSPRRVAGPLILGVALATAGSTSRDSATPARIAATTLPNHSPSPSPSPRATAIVAALDVARLARTTSRSGPARFRSDLVYETDLDHPLSRIEGLVDWATSRAAATELEDVAALSGGSTAGLRAVARLWVTPHGTLEADLDGGSVHPQVVSGTSVSVLGLADPSPLPADAVATLQRTLQDLLGGQVFDVGTRETVGRSSVTRYRGRPRSTYTGRLDVWVTDEGRLARLERHGDEAYNPVVVILELSDYGTRAAIDAPPHAT